MGSVQFDLAEAMQLAVHAEFDLAILDVDLGGSVITPVVKLIEERRSPFFITTGHGAAHLAQHFPGRHGYRSRSKSNSWLI